MPQHRTALADLLLDLARQQVNTHALVLLDAQGTIIGWLAGAERLFGYRADEIIGKNAAILFTPEDLANNLSAWELQTATVSGESEDDRWQVRKDGGRIWVSGTLTALRDNEGTLVGFTKIMRNRTDMKSQIETLESRISALHNAEQRKNTFIATLAHELRSPLYALSNAAYLLQDSKSDSDDLGLSVGIVRRQVEFMARMVNDLLDVSRCAAGKIELQKQRVVLQEVLQKSVETSELTLKEFNQTLRQSVPSVPICIDADPVRLQQAFVNLIDNAAKYMPKEGSIWIKATVEGNEAVVRVQDTGIGIAPDMMPHIFELFTQAEPANRLQKGLGIGLSVVKETVELHGGSVQAASDGVGKGCEFTVRLPLFNDAPSSPH